ncbi:uncharacterized protein (TIGR01732 family) [Mesobacillus foraminis]|uniref:Uncharacterized protein (TIGR01732 family) n=1 Tax=Mesobacillus foraminis TaxID=279826 RepID=A0A4R2BA68_9BACI|nr:uncharacterized protein (TIGR01732 family) [Mesobacillus foraminis]
MYNYDNMAAPMSSPNMPAPMTAPMADYNMCGYPYAGVAGAGFGCHNTFVLVVVLFILLIIIGCSCGNW